MFVTVKARVYTDATGACTDLPVLLTPAGVLEPLLAFPGGALVHFAVSQSEVHMCTRLAGPASQFLPFNRGWSDEAGNPPNPDGLKTDYLWKRILTRDGLTDIVENYAQIVETTGDPGFAEAVEVCRATGATVTVVPGGTLVDRRFAFATLLPATSAASGVLADRGGHDIDDPTWTAAYYATARASGTP